MKAFRGLTDLLIIFGLIFLVCWVLVHAEPDICLKVKDYLRSLI